MEKITSIPSVEEIEKAAKISEATKKVLFFGIYGANALKISVKSFKRIDRSKLEVIGILKNNYQHYSPNFFNVRIVWDGLKNSGTAEFRKTPVQGNETSAKCSACNGNIVEFTSMTFLPEGATVSHAAYCCSKCGIKYEFLPEWD